MKGISPVIATVLLLLMAVAATGGAWVWYQQMQASATTSGTTGAELITTGAAIQLVGINRAYMDTTLKFDISNLGTSDVTIDSISVKNSTGLESCIASSTTATKEAVTLGVTCTTDHGLSSGNSATVKLYFSGGSTRDFFFKVE